MARARLSRRAYSDLLEIAAYTMREWGRVQSGEYLGSLEACCDALANDPPLGRRCENIRPGLRRMEHGKHVVFYRRERGDILVSRVLHQRVLPEKHEIS